LNKKKKYFFYLVLIVYLFSFLLSNQLNFSYNLKYAEGKGNSRNYFENYFNINYFFDNGLYIFSQLEYSSPSLIGYNTENVNDALNTFYMEYSGKSYDLTVGNLNLLYGRGLSIHTYQDRSIDYDNTLIGLETNFYIRDNIDFSVVLGTTDFKSRINPGDMLPSLSIDNNMIAFNLLGYFNNINVHYSGMIYDQEYDYHDIYGMMSLSNNLGNYLSSREDFIINEQPNDNLRNVEHNFSLDFIFSGISFYLENSFVFYDKLLAERMNGSRTYFSSYVNILDFDIFFEYKDYNTPYLFSIFSNSPIGYRESSSVLLSRYSHSIDFNNEYGYQLEINKSFDSSFNFLCSYATALRHRDNLSDPYLYKLSEISFYSNDLLKYSDFSPFRQLYFEFSGWDKTDEAYYKIGFDLYHEIQNAFVDEEIVEQKYIFTRTIPTQFVLKLNKANSITFYIELQEKVDNITNEKSSYRYFSPSYNRSGIWSLTLFSDQKLGDKLWQGIDYTYNFKNSSQLSLFFGSQKGGLVCANGSCVVQPDFEEGMKITYLVSI
tara:strand:- start:2288 stop:3925 length:1638 start_codon:yes stop_codon:yes gene_type:complete